MALDPDNPYTIVSSIAAPINLYTSGGLIGSPSDTITLIPQNPSPVAGYAQLQQLGYELSFTGQIASTATDPFVLVQMQFYDVDEIGVAPIDAVSWYLPLGNPDATNLFGHGPERGAYMSVTLTFPPGSPDGIWNMSISDVSRFYSRDDWRSASLPTVPGYINSGGSPENLILGELNNVASPATRLLPTYAGKVRYLINWGSSTGNITVKIAPVNAGIIAPVNITGSESNAPASGEFNMGRDSYMVELSGTPGNVSISLTMDEY
ncbi:MAG TPA: hypothetical protein VN861_14665 [Candidatus Acidoferrales bacterium]|nr:hypothetical protein [Candidatus Acidoferrales bacterium]